MVGSWFTTLKRLYGAAFTAPSAESVVTMVIGRGRIVPKKQFVPVCRLHGLKVELYIPSKSLVARR
jgi:hypothetical protein